MKKKYVLKAQIREFVRPYIWAFMSNDLLPYFESIISANDSIFSARFLCNPHFPNKANSCDEPAFASSPVTFLKNLLQSWTFPNDEVPHDPTILVDDRFRESVYEQDLLPVYNSFVNTLFAESFSHTTYNDLDLVCQPLGVLFVVHQHDWIHVVPPEGYRKEILLSTQFMLSLKTCKETIFASLQAFKADLNIDFHCHFLLIVTEENISSFEAVRSMLLEKIAGEFLGYPNISIQFTLELSKVAISYYLERHFHQGASKSFYPLITEVSAQLHALELTSSSSIGQLDTFTRSKFDPSSLLDVSSKVPNAFLKYFTGSSAPSILSQKTHTPTMLMKLSADAFLSFLTKLKKLADYYMLMRDYKTCYYYYDILLRKVIPISFQSALADKTSSSDVFRIVYNQSLERFLLSAFLLTEANGKDVRNDDLFLLTENTNLLLAAIGRPSPAKSAVEQAAPTSSRPFHHIEYLESRYFMQMYLNSEILLENNRENDYINYVYRQIYKFNDSWDGILLEKMAIVYLLAKFKAFKRKAMYYYVLACHQYLKCNIVDQAFKCMFNACFLFFSATRGNPGFDDKSSRLYSPPFNLSMLGNNSKNWTAIEQHLLLYSSTCVEKLHLDMQLSSFVDQLRNQSRTNDLAEKYVSSEASADIEVSDNFSTSGKMDLFRGQLVMFPVTIRRNSGEQQYPLTFKWSSFGHIYSHGPPFSTSIFHNVAIPFIQRDEMDIEARTFTLNIAECQSHIVYFYIYIPEEYQEKEFVTVRLEAVMPDSVFPKVWTWYITLHECKISARVSTMDIESYTNQFQVKIENDFLDYDVYVETLYYAAIQCQIFPVQISPEIFTINYELKHVEEGTKNFAAAESQFAANMAREFLVQQKVHWPSTRRRMQKAGLASGSMAKWRLEAIDFSNSATFNVPLSLIKQQLLDEEHSAQIRSKIFPLLCHNQLDIFLLVSILPKNVSYLFPAEKRYVLIRVPKLFVVENKHGTTTVSWNQYIDVDSISWSSLEEKERKNLYAATFERKISMIEPLLSPLRISDDPWHHIDLELSLIHQRQSSSTRPIKCHIVNKSSIFRFQYALQLSSSCQILDSGAPQAGTLGTCDQVTVYLTVNSSTPPRFGPINLMVRSTTERTDDDQDRSTWKALHSNIVYFK